VEERAQQLGERAKLEAQAAADPQPTQAEARRQADDALNEKTQSFMSKLSENSRKLLSTENKFVMGGTKFDSSLDSINYFPEDKHKNDRFKLFVVQREKGFGGDIPYPLGFRASDIQREALEFSKYYALYEDKKLKEEIFQTGPQQLLMQIDELSKKLESSKKKRIREDWIPEKVVCIRFSVPQPKKKATQVEDSTFDEKVLPRLEKDLKSHRFMGGLAGEPRPAAQPPGEGESGEAEDRVIMPDENNIHIRRADPDLFDAIFN